MFPLAAVGGVGALSFANYIEGLPSELRNSPSPQVTKIYANDGQTLITQFYTEYRQYVPASEISPNMLKAIVAAEDSRFYEHQGVDTRGVLRAFVANSGGGGVSQGASTLTMQYVRNVQRDSAKTPSEVLDATQQSASRKLAEMRLAVAVERKLTKQQILERYLNVAYFGHRAYGIYAAAQIYFSKPPSDLNLAEAATLAGLVQAPTNYDPSSNPTAATNRRNYVLDRMMSLKYLSPELAAQTKAQKITLRLYDPPNDCTAIDKQHNDWGFFCDMVKNWWIRQPAFGANVEARSEDLKTGGYSVITTLDPKLQKIAFDQVTSQESIGSSYALGLVAIEPGTGQIKAAAVNRNYSLDSKNNGPHTNAEAARLGIASSYPNTVAPLLGMGDMPGYQAGSTFKIFTMTAALEQGMPLSTKIDSPMTVRTKYVTSPSDPSACKGTDVWCPHNASAAMTGVQDMYSGFGKSVNTFFVQLEERVGVDNAVKMAQRLGLTWHTDTDQGLAANPSNWGSFTLGTADTTPVEMANAYATIAGDGVYCPATPVLAIYTPDGRRLPAGDPNCRQEVSPDVAHAAADATRCPTGDKPARGSCGGWSTAPGVHSAVGRPVGGKTGTTEDTRSAWFVGMTPSLAAAAFIADPDNPNHVAGDWNSEKPVNAVAGLLKLGSQGTPARDFPPPSGQMVGGGG
jgi:membrane peptidoglycan carboxypeptidase